MEQDPALKAIPEPVWCLGVAQRIRVHRPSAAQIGGLGWSVLAWAQACGLHSGILLRKPPLAKGLDDLKRDPLPVWSVLSLSSIEQLSEAVQGAGLSATQMSSTPVSGSLAFAESRGVSFTTGLIDSKVSLTGPLSEDKITLGLGIDLPPGTRHWLNEVGSGDIGVFMPGDEHDSLYVPGSLYAVFTLSAETLEQLAAQRELVLSSAMLGGSGVYGRRLPPAQLAHIKRLFARLHGGGIDGAAGGLDAGTCLVDTLVGHLALRPRASIGVRDPRGHARIVSRWSASPAPRAHRLAPCTARFACCSTRRRIRTS